MKIRKLRSLLPAVTPKQVAETGLLAVLGCLGLGLYQEQWAWCKAALVLGILLLLAPRAYYPLAVAWFALGRGLGLATTPLLLTGRAGDPGGAAQKVVRERYHAPQIIRARGGFGLRRSQPPLYGRRSGPSLLTDALRLNSQYPILITL
jgi:hypothetical protein